MIALAQDEEHTTRTSTGSRTVPPAEVALLMQAQTPSDGSVGDTEEAGVEEEAHAASFRTLPSHSVKGALLTLGQLLLAKATIARWRMLLM